MIKMTSVDHRLVKIFFAKCGVGNLKSLYTPAIFKELRNIIFYIDQSTYFDDLYYYIHIKLISQQVN